MGLCYSKSGWIETSNGSYTESSELSTSNSKSLSYESPRWSAETGDKGKLGTLFYKRRRRRRFIGNQDLFSARIEGLLGGFQNLRHSPGEIAFASFVGTPFVRNLEMQGMDAIARSYAISAAKASARNTFLLLQERDKSENVEVFSPMIKIQTPDRSSVDEAMNEIIILDEGEPDLEDFERGVRLDSPDDDEIEVLEEHTSFTQGDDSRSSELSDLYEEDIDLGASYKAGMQRVEQRSFFESCFPATGRWASVVNAARQSACLPRTQNSPSRNNGTGVREPSALLESSELESYHEGSQEVSDRLQLTYGPQRSQIFEAGRFSGSETCSESGHACMGCCGSRDDTAPTSVTNHSRSVTSETGSSSIQLPQGAFVRYDPGNVGVQSGESSPKYETSPPSEDIEDKVGSAISTPSHGLRVIIPEQRHSLGSRCTSMCSTPEHQVQTGQCEQPDTDLDAFFSFPSSPSTKVLEEVGSRDIIEDLKSVNVREDLTFRRQFHEEQVKEEEALEGPRSRAESPRGGHALSKGAFGSPFPVLGASGRKTRPIFDKKMKFFSLERASTAALAKKIATSDGTLASSTDSYLDTSSSSLSRRRDTHDLEDYSSDLFEIQDMQPMSMKPFSGLELSCLPIKKSFGCSHEICQGSPEVNSAPPCESSALRYQIRGTNAVRGANNRARILREQASKKAKSEQVKSIPAEVAKYGYQPSKGISVTMLGLLRRKHIEDKPVAGKSGALPVAKPTIIIGPIQPHNSENKPSKVARGSSLDTGKYIKGLSIREVLERHEKYD